MAVANGLGNAKKILDGIKEGSGKYDFIEVMACPGGEGGRRGSGACNIRKAQSVV